MDNLILAALLILSLYVELRSRKSKKALSVKKAFPL